MTSNLGGDIIQAADEGRRGEGRDRRRCCKATFKPEFLNRIDETIFFNRLGQARDPEDRGHPARAARDAAARSGRSTWRSTRRRRRTLAEAGYDPQYGARPLKRTIQNLVQNPLARKVLSGDVADGDTAVVDAGKDEIVFRKK